MKLRTITINEAYVIIYNHMVLYTKCSRKKIEEYLKRCKVEEGIFGEEFTPQELVERAVWVTYLYVEDEKEYSKDLKKKNDRAGEALEMAANLKKNLGDRFGMVL